jgi:hypothetical protein
MIGVVVRARHRQSLKATLRVQAGPARPIMNPRNGSCGLGSKIEVKPMATICRHAAVALKAACAALISGWIAACSHMLHLFVVAALLRLDKLGHATAVVAPACRYFFIKGRVDPFDLVAVRLFLPLIKSLRRPFGGW